MNRAEEYAQWRDSPERARALSVSRWEPPAEVRVYRTRAPEREPVEWTEAGWRMWRIDPTTGLLRNPWTNSGTCWLWSPAVIQEAECFWNTGCRGLVAKDCSCGIRSMRAVSHLASFLARDSQLGRHPDKAAVVGRVRLGGRVQYGLLPGLGSIPGYQRSQFAEIDGPLYVSPRAAEHFETIAGHYDSARTPVVGPDFVTGASGQQDWLERLAGELPNDATDGQLDSTYVPDDRRLPRCS
ncbi:hypothetical protein [Nocardioides sp.]|uniref:hypothetical protein n=1 Tax=Nocardioides sp. TaxID=35761 RepID=UPI00260FF97C|nr:hypothetical protein [Nocardioides sp.]MCW2736110.1 hypothetical protein [Nocardioides sp.]